MLEYLYMSVLYPVRTVASGELGDKKQQTTTMVSGLSLKTINIVVLMLMICLTYVES